MSRCGSFPFFCRCEWGRVARGSTGVVKSSWLKGQHCPLVFLKGQHCPLVFFCRCECGGQGSHKKPLFSCIIFSIFAAGVNVACRAATTSRFGHIIPVCPLNVCCRCEFVAGRAATKSRIGHIIPASPSHSSLQV